MSALPVSLPDDLRPWAEAFAAAAAGAAEAVAGLAGTPAGREGRGEGAGGDTTFELDRAAERSALAALTRLAGEGHPCSVLSEEQGRLSLGDGDGPLILIDPVDGSLNAKRGIPIYAATYALLDGETLGSVRLGLVHDLVRGESFWAWRGGGAWCGESRLSGSSQASGSPRLEMLAFEVSRKAGEVDRLARALQHAHRVRIFGCQALALAYVAAGRVDGLFANTSRSIDCAAGLLLIEEAGGRSTTLEGAPLGQEVVWLDNRVTLAVGADGDRHRELLSWMGGG